MVILEWRSVYSVHISQSKQSDRLFLQSSEMGLPHPLTEGECAPPPPGSGGGGTLACARGDMGFKFRRGDRHCGTLDIYVLCREQNTNQPPLYK